MKKEQYERLSELRKNKKLNKDEQIEFEHLERVLEKYGYEKKGK